jgi:two-component system KDP operon response regulator KdpE
MSIATNKPRILVIEDEAPIRKLLRVALTHHDYELIEASNGKEGLVRAAEFPPDVVILDLGLPDMEGIAVLRSLREWSKSPVIVLTARGHEAEKVTVLDAGADDYVTKPFGANELIARIRVALRHSSRGEAGQQEPVFRSGDLRVDQANRRVFVRESEVHLTPIEYRLLSVLIGQAGKVLTHQYLLKEVWGPGHSQETHYLRVHMAQLRRKIERSSADPRHLLTEPGVGYRLISDADFPNVR